MIIDIPSGGTDHTAAKEDVESGGFGRRILLRAQLMVAPSGVENPTPRYTSRSVNNIGDQHGAILSPPTVDRNRASRQSDVGPTAPAARANSTHRSCRPPALQIWAAV
jgi:hypothetical protein